MLWSKLIIEYQCHELSCSYITVVIKRNCFPSFRVAVPFSLSSITTSMKIKFSIFFLEIFRSIVNYLVLQACEMCFIWIFLRGEMSHRDTTASHIIQGLWYQWFDLMHTWYEHQKCVISITLSSPCLQTSGITCRLNRFFNTKIKLSQTRKFPGLPLLFPCSLTMSINWEGGDLSSPGISFHRVSARLVYLLNKIIGKNPFIDFQLNQTL